MYTVKLHRTGSDLLVAACDRELIGRTLREGELRLEVRKSFYSAEDGDEEMLLNRLSLATMANLVGERTVGIAIEHDYVCEESVMVIEGVPHAQMVKM
jgi:hypothetical protein